ncbi:hypothetical protein QWY84_09410 [Aquisalimonas lutea]|uniref:hypothetical protein n=1 Tax=Aquisalimonas lutea TaxID=1327750 RepID=UPI0025B5FE5B|nr:hypothetical protein [Aquisalimonas lutea]MDN3517827.1 hypothetical protein [Aquisalimonas lutea]
MNEVAHCATTDAYYAPSRFNLIIGILRKDSFIRYFPEISCIYMGNRLPLVFRSIFLLFFIVIGWDGVVLGNPVIRPPVVIGALLIPSLFVLAVTHSGRRIVGIFRLEDIALLIFLVAIVASWFFNPVSTDPAYVAAYTFVFVGFYFAPKFFLDGKFGGGAVLRCNLIGVALVVLYVYTEVALAATSDIELGQWVGKLKEEDALATVLGVRWPRAYGLSEEPLNLALYLACAGALAVWFAWRCSRKLGVIVLCATIVAWALAFSTAGLVAAVIGFAAVISKWFIRKARQRYGLFRKSTVVTALVGGVGLAMGIALIAAGPMAGVEFSVIDKLERYGSGPRFKNALETLERIGPTDTPFFGVGLGSGLSDIGGSAINWYLTLLYQGGLIPLTFILLFLFTIVLRHFRGASSLSDVGLFVSFYAGVHYLATATFFQPAAWVVLAVIGALESSGNGQVAVTRRSDDGK